MLFGKGYFVHYISRLGGVTDYPFLARDAKIAGVTHAIIKVCDGAGRGTEGNVLLGVDLVPAFADALKNEGIQVLGFGAVNGTNVVGEVAVALSMIQKFDLDGFVINAESAMKTKWQQARDYMAGLRPQTNIPLYLSSYRYPSYHMEFPWRQYFEGGLDGYMPQIYWIGSHNPVYQLNKSVMELEDLYNNLSVQHIPIIATGAAFEEAGWKPTANEIRDFMLGVKNLVSQRRVVDATNFWEWYHAVRKVPEAWPTIAAFEWGTTPPIPNPDVPVPIGVGKVLESDGVNIRTSYNSNAPYRGAYGKDATPYIFEHRIISASEEWIRTGENMWSAMKYNGNIWIRWEKRY